MHLISLVSLVPLDVLLRDLKRSGERQLHPEPRMHRNIHLPFRPRQYYVPCPSLSNIHEVLQLKKRLCVHEMILCCKLASPQ